MNVSMYGENECRYYSSSPSSTSSHQSQFSPSTLCNPNSPSSNTQTQSVLSSHKRKAGRKKFKETRHPVYRGVRQRNGNKWVCEIREPNKKSRIWLGTYPTPEVAAMAHDVAALALKGTSATFNFPDSVSLLPVANSSSAADIREAASRMSKVFGPSSSSSSSFPMVEGREEKVVEDESKSGFIDEEALFNMPGLLDSMAEGLLITPPSMKKAFDWDDVDSEFDLTLWTD
ncbi:hypothetical protein VNO77_28780 [Canavalia gladiata]|uniref:AP2/ERF domain-containing protein n=1 Tax=Canavalia gladiata TaxID=3824 RepID=A0AAN9KZM9_CANGL